MVPEQPIRAGPSLSDTPTAAPPRRGLGGGSGVAGEAGGRSCCGTVGVDCCGTVALPVLQGSGGLSQAVREFKFCKSIRETKLLGMCEGRAAKCHGTSVIEAPSSRLGFEEGGGGASREPGRGPGSLRVAASGASGAECSLDAVRLEDLRVRIKGTKDLRGQWLTNGVEGEEQKERGIKE